VFVNIKLPFATAHGIGTEQYNFTNNVFSTFCDTCPNEIFHKFKPFLEEIIDFIFLEGIRNLYIHDNNVL